MNRPAFLLSTPAQDPFFADPQRQKWFRLYTPLVGGYSPSFDPVAKWHPAALFYFDSYAIYDVQYVTWRVNEFYSDTDKALILTDSAGNPLKINWQDADGTYRQYAGDITNPAFVAKAISLIRNVLALGYAGVMLDDVNLAPTFVNEAGQPVIPFDTALWKVAMIRYMQQVRAAFPGKVIMHNPVWWEADPEEIKAADYINVERGFGDPNFGPVDYIRLERFINQVHGLGRKVVVSETLTANLPKSLPCYDLVCAEGDLIACADMTPDKWAL